MPIRIHHIETGLVFVELPGCSDTAVEASWQATFGELVATIGTRTVIIHAPDIGWYTAGAGGTRKPVRLNAFTSGEAIAAAAIENDRREAPWFMTSGRVPAFLIACLPIIVIAKRL